MSEALLLDEELAPSSKFDALQFFGYTNIFGVIVCHSMGHSQTIETVSCSYTTI